MDHRSAHHELNDWLDRNGYHHAHARKRETPHPYGISPRTAHARIDQEHPYVTSPRMAHAHIDQEHPYVTSPRMAHAVIKISSRDPAAMTAGQINKELDKLDAQNDRQIQRMIDAGRGNERPSDYQRLDDPLSVELRGNADRRWTLKNEIERRYGPGAPSRLPRGFGPLRTHARVIHQEPTGRPVFAAHERDHHITTAGRRALKRSQFALPPGPEEKRRGIKGRLPLDDIARARSALARASMMAHQGHITAKQLKAARRAVHRAWPSIRIEAL